MAERRRRLVAFVVLTFIFVLNIFYTEYNNPLQIQIYDTNSQSPPQVLAVSKLGDLQIKGRAPKTGYSRQQFDDGWAMVDGCDVRNLILQRDLLDVVLAEDNCTVISGVLQDPYTGKEINFRRGSSTSSQVQIDHVVALSDAWAKGAQGLSVEVRQSFANDFLNLLAVDGPSNVNKGDSDSASWLPPNKSFRCLYVSRQIAVKTEYNLWVTESEYVAIKKVLNNCPNQTLPDLEEVHEN